MAFSKHATVVFGLSLMASTASASIPDANGVIHGCYNVLSGSTRIIDGTTCGLLEKAVTWNQTGPRGPVGPQGPQGNNNIVVGSGDALISGTIPAHTQMAAYINEYFKPTSNGFCNIQIHSALSHTIEGAAMAFTAELGGGTGETTGWAAAPYVPFSPNAQGEIATMTLHFPIEAGQTYRFGAEFRTQDVAVTSIAATVSFDVTYTCKLDQN